MEFHYDSGAIIKHQTTPDGYLRAYMRLARVGEMTYLNTDGTKRVEVLTPNELFRKDSYDTFKMLPVTLGHPSEPVNPSNARIYTRGATGHTIIADGEFLGIVGTVFDKDTIEAIATGKASQVSPGYRVKTTPRTDGKLLQQGRIGNHVAAVTVARGGEGVRFVLDSADSPLWIAQSELEQFRIDVDDEFVNALLERQSIETDIVRKTPVNLDAVTLTPDQQWNTTKTQDERLGIIRAAIRQGSTASLPDAAKTWAEENRIRIDTGEIKPMTQILIGKRIFNVDGADAPALSEAIATLETNIETLATEKTAAEKERDEAKSQASTLEAEKSTLQGNLDGLQTRLDAAEKTRMDADTISTEIKVRMDAWNAVLPTFRADDAEFQPDYNLDETGIRKAYLAKVKPDLKLDSADANYINGLWDALKPSGNVSTSARTDSTTELETLLNQNRTDMGDYGKGMTDKRKSRGLPGMKTAS